MRGFRNSYACAKPLELSIIQMDGGGGLSTATSSIFLLRRDQLSLLNDFSRDSEATCDLKSSSNDEEGEMMLPSRHDFLRLCARQCGVALSPLSVFDLMLKMKIESSVGGLKSDLLGWLFMQLKEGASTLLSDKGGDGFAAVSNCLEWLQSSSDPSGALSDLVHEVCSFDTNDLVHTFSSITITATDGSISYTISESLARYVS